MEDLYFKVNAEIKSVVGRDLINNDTIGVIELVKNAYDAGSRLVDIFFENIIPQKNKNSRLVIQDYGCGMTLEELKNKWLNIAYSEKKQHRMHGGRVVAGNKGVGRFSCDRLGEVLDLYTRPAGGDYIHLSVVWSDFEDADINTQVINIPVRYQIIKASDFEATTQIKSFSSGTRLEIHPLHNDWNIDKLTGLRRALEKFANPNQGFEEDSFRIELHCRDYLSHDMKALPVNRVNGPVINTVYKDLGFRTSYIESTIDAVKEDGTKGDFITTTLYHRGKSLFTVVEKNRFLHLSGVKVVIYFLNQYHKGYFKRATGQSVVDYGSVFLFLNGFRVPPYGDRGNDWLGLDIRKTQATRRALGTREILGRIEISDVFNQWKIVSSREGLVHNPLFNELVDGSSSFFYSVLRKLERYVVNGINWDSTPSTWHEIEKKIAHAHSPTGLINEQYILDEKEKEKRLLGVLRSIILQGTKDSDIELIEFNSGLMEMLTRQEEKETEEFIKQFSDIAGRSERPPKGNVKKFLLEAADELRKAKDLARSAKEAKDKANAERRKAEDAARRAEAGRQKAEELQRKSEEEKNKTAAIARVRDEENLFLKATRNKDVDDIIDLHHQVVTWAGVIEKDITRILKRIAQGKEVSVSSIVPSLERICVQNRKILQVASFATKAKFKISAQLVTNNIASFIRRYVSDLQDSKLAKLSFLFQGTDNASFVATYKPIEITILIDNLISNSVKAKATRFYVTLNDCTETQLAITFDDDGRGLDPTLPSPSLIFERGVTTTDGSGIGLNHVREIAASLGGSVDIVDSNLGGFALQLRVAK